MIYLGIIGGILAITLIIGALARSSASERTNWSNDTNSTLKELETVQLEMVMNEIEKGNLDDRIHLNEMDQLVLGNAENQRIIRELGSNNEEIVSLVKKAINNLPPRILESGKAKIKHTSLIYITDAKWKAIGGY